ncbi:MAG: Trm112 family protein [Sciscionella sp.]|nr:Trm112 family protein [Sciscionella sp.]
MTVKLDERLLDILACPAEDHAPLIVGRPDDADADALTCTSCGRVYPVRDGIPVLLLDEASEPSQPDAKASRPDAEPKG